MEDIISKIIASGLGNVIDKRRDPLLLADEIYRKDCSDLAELEDRYSALDLTKESRMLIDDYIACSDTAHGRANDLCYIAGIRDAILFLSQVGLIQNKTEEKGNRV